MCTKQYFKGQFDHVFVFISLIPYCFRSNLYVQAVSGKLIYNNYFLLGGFSCYIDEGEKFMMYIVYKLGSFFRTKFPPKLLWNADKLSHLSFPLTFRILKIGMMSDLTYRSHRIYYVCTGTSANIQCLFLRVWTSPAWLI